jgi:hypothetical protein
VRSDKSSAIRSKAETGRAWRGCRRPNTPVFPPERVWVGADNERSTNRRIAYQSKPLGWNRLKPWIGGTVACDHTRSNQSILAPNGKVTKQTSTAGRHSTTKLAYVQCT